MPTIPSGDKIVFTSADVELKERKSARINAQSQVYTMQDITDTVNAGGSGPTSLFDLDDASKNSNTSSESFQIGNTSTDLTDAGTGGNIYIQSNAYSPAMSTSFTQQVNTVVGQEAGGTATYSNTGSVTYGLAAFGYRALYNFGNTSNDMTLAGSTTSIGYASGTSFTSGTNCTFIGFSAGSNYNPTFGTNVTCLGAQAQASSNTATNEITLGNTSISVLRCAVTSITSLSDERDKKDITDLEYGLDFIESLQPKQFTWDNRPETQKVSDLDENGNIKEVEKEIESANKGKKDFGFIAQDVQPLDNDVLRLVYDENPDKLEMSYGKLVPILVKAVKELSEKVKALEAN